MEKQAHILVSAVTIHQLSVEFRNRVDFCRLPHVRKRVSKLAPQNSRPILSGCDLAATSTEIHAKNLSSVIGRSN